MSTTTPTEWSLAGSVLIACNCDWGCPCNFNAMPSTGHCEGGWTWHVDRGRVDSTALDGLSFSVFCKWPGAVLARSDWPELSRLQGAADRWR